MLARNERITDNPWRMRATLRPAEPGSKIGSFRIVSRRASDDMWGRDDDDRCVLIATGSTTSVAMEAHAIGVLRAHVRVPEVVESSEDSAFGPYLALSVPASTAESLAAFAEHATIEESTTALRTILEVAATIERDGLGWSPRLDDLYVDGGSVGLRRMRGGRRLAKKGRVDARHLLEEVGRAFVEPGTMLAPSMVRLLLPNDRARAEGRAIEEVRAAFEAAAPSQPLPDDEAEGVATLADLGLLRERHEDAVAFARGEGWAAMAVCDGVSASYRSDLASALAAETVRDRLAAEHSLAEPTGVIHAAIREAHHAICRAREASGDEPAGTTIVAALVQGRRVALGWVGDSRAYWIGKGGGDALLTRDHSWLNDVLASGILTPEEALASPHAHALTRCLGPLEGGDPLLHAEPDLLEFDVPGPGHLVLCTDGLWNYFPSPDSLAVLIERAGEPRRASAIARVLVNAALTQGGQDNVTVGVIAIE